LRRHFRRRFFAHSVNKKANMERRRRGGFTVMEIMVCLTVMSVVVIGASGMLLQSGRLARNATQTAEASVLASELVAMLRQRSRVGTEAAWPARTRQLDFKLAERSGGGLPDCRLRACIAEEALEFELNDWSARAAAVLPSARLVLCRDHNPWNAGAGQFDWPCSMEATAPLLIKLGWKANAPADAGLRPLLVMAIE
jgi:type IV pilus assembly protein PilV